MDDLEEANGYELRAGTDDLPEDDEEPQCAAIWVVGQFHGFQQYDVCPNKVEVKDADGDWWCEEHADLNNIQPAIEGVVDSPTFHDFDSDEYYARENY